MFNQYAESCSCGATYASSGNYMSERGAKDWRSSHLHREPIQQADTRPHIVIRGEPRVRVGRCLRRAAVAKTRGKRL